MYQLLHVYHRGNTNLSRNPELLDECHQLLCSGLCSSQLIVQLFTSHEVMGLKNSDLIHLGDHPGD